MAGDDRTLRNLPRWTGAAVFVFVLLVIAGVLLATQIPHAKRPVINPPPHTTVITITTTTTPNS